MIEYQYRKGQPMIVSRFQVLLAEKAIRERRRISLTRVAEETEISIYTITGFANNTLREAPLDAIDALCGYLGCDVGDLLVRVPDGDAAGNLEPDLEAVLASVTL